MLTENSVSEVVVLVLPRTSVRFDPQGRPTIQPHPGRARTTWTACQPSIPITAATIASASS
jgi:hypothetical protein